ncbi:MAG: hypothetical protein IIA67_07635 [Planctomycetes bacterium]|nr:hypothetical protein [Planctomycetota bacterium]
MKLAARICGVLSVLFLGVCIVACAARSERATPPAKTAKTVEKKTGEKKTAKPSVKKTEAKKKTG